MLYFNSMLKDKYKDYSNVDTKISREIKCGNLHRVVKGIYETNINTPGYLLSTVIYGPSYISFEYALEYYGLIPERVYTVTCASFNKKKKKTFNTKFGTFTYRDIPKLAFPEEIQVVVEGGYSYKIASKEKALCDKLYTLRPLKNYKTLEHTLFRDLRIDEDEFYELDANKITALSALYNSTNVKLLAKYIRRLKNE